ncbi:4Fe-4S dicluster domain-containing protein, partial [Rhodothermus sp. AH-315-K08]|nr:4Fe-4S dicluster domain-containing protein [Rhodothermus sp. AH-315-K08]
HWLIFWGFVVLFIGTTIVAIDHDFLRFFGVHVLQGTFYLGFSLSMDVAGVLFLVGLGMMMVRRGGMKPAQLDYSRSDRKGQTVDRSGFTTDDKIFVWLLFMVAVTGFLLEGLRIAADRPAFEVWSPIGWATAGMIDGIGLTPFANTWHAWTWWIHAVMVLGFIGYIPYSKAMHILVDFANLVFSDESSAKRLPRVSEEQMDAGAGYASITDFSWKELLDFDACTKCGRCHVACPANASGGPLSPRDLILDLRTYADATIGAPEWFGQSFGDGAKWPGDKLDGVSVAGDVIKPETLWACTTCMACVETCPVGIEHITSIVQLRRNLVEEGEMPEMLQDALANIGDYGNSFGQSERARAKWTRSLDFKIKDARKEEVDFLWFVGDYASYDSRGQELSQSVARVLHGLDVDFGLLYEGEKNSGNDVRRVGEEGLYEMLAEDNIATFEKAKFSQIITTDPHSYNTILNEYPDFGGEYTIRHYTEVLASWIEKGTLRFGTKLNVRATYHDPCYLGRYNGVISPPRQILKALGVDFHEMARCGANSFCCGAGGGRIWMDDSELEERPSEIRIREALEIEGVEVFVVACPKDYAMYSDAVKTSGNEGKIVVKDIIQLVEEALLASA